MTLPNGWKSRTLAEVATITMGQSPPGSSYNDNGVGLPFFQGKAEFGEVHPTVRKYTTAGTKHAKTGDILMSVRAPVGPTNIADIDCVIGRGLAAIRGNELISQHYLTWTLKHLEIEIQSKGKGTTFDSISGDALRSTVVALPEIAEQEKIVEILEDHLSRLDAALADVKQASIRTESLRTSLLHTIFDEIGKNHPNDAKQLGSVAQLINGDRGKNYPSKSKRTQSGVPFINAGHINNGSLDEKNMDFISQETYEILGSGKVEVGDIIYCIRGSLGKVAINMNYEQGAIASSLVILRTHEPLLPKFLYYFLQSPNAAMQIKLYDNGTAQPNLSAANLKKFILTVPSLSIQKQSIEAIEYGLVRIEKYFLTSTEVTRQVQNLRRSLLQAAFTGRLTKEESRV
jgi:type I restriction enzyme S subunit